MVATTEIFRNGLQRDSGFAQRVALAVFDEVHYMNDDERGGTWEEENLSPLQLLERQHEARNVCSPAVW